MSLVGNSNHIHFEIKCTSHTQIYCPPSQLRHIPFSRSRFQCRPLSEVSCSNAAHSKLSLVGEAHVVYSRGHRSRSNYAPSVKDSPQTPYPANSKTLRGLYFPQDDNASRGWCTHHSSFSTHFLCRMRTPASWRPNYSMALSTRH